MQRALGKGTPSKGQTNLPLNTTNNTNADNSPLSTNTNSAIGAVAIGTGLGLGSERDKNRRVSPMHDLVLLSLKTLSYLSVPSGRLILLIKVCIVCLCVNVCVCVCVCVCACVCMCASIKSNLSSHSWKSILHCCITLNTATHTHSYLFPYEQNSVLPYLFSDDYLIRKEAATTCARMLVAAIHRYSVV